MRTKKDFYYEYKNVADKYFGGLAQAITEYVEWLEYMTESNGVDNDGNPIHYGFG